jgi:hypothetical protein
MLVNQTGLRVKCIPRKPEQPCRVVGPIVSEHGYAAILVKANDGLYAVQLVFIDAAFAQRDIETGTNTRSPAKVPLTISLCQSSCGKQKNHGHGNQAQDSH